MENYGRVAFEKYKHVRRGVTHNGEAIPTWDELDEGIRDAWEDAAQTVINYERMTSPRLGPQISSRPYVEFAGHVQAVMDKTGMDFTQALSIVCYVQFVRSGGSYADV